MMPGLQVGVHRDHHVLLGRHQPEQPDVLERPGQPHRRPDVRLDRGDVLALEEDRALGGLVQAGDAR